MVRIDKSRVVESEHIILNGKSCSLNWAIACFDLNAQYIYVGGAYERAPEEKKKRRFTNVVELLVSSFSRVEIDQ